jgi:hypothetical protein
MEIVTCPQPKIHVLVYSLERKSSIYEVHQFSSLVINFSLEIEYRSEKSILAVKEYKHFQQKHLEFFKPVS